MFFDHISLNIRNAMFWFFCINQSSVLFQRHVDSHIDFISSVTILLYNFFINFRSGHQKVVNTTVDSYSTSSAIINARFWGALKAEAQLVI